MGNIQSLRIPNLGKKAKAESSTANAPFASASTNLPPPPKELLAHRTHFEIPLIERCKTRVDPEHDTDTPLAAIYRIYEHIMLDQHIEYRNEIERFWYRGSAWSVKDIPDPRDSDPERYAVVSCVPVMLCEAFNERIDLGLIRDAPPIFSPDQLEEWRARDRQREEEPAWVAGVPCLESVLAIPHWDNDKRDFVPLESFTEDASPIFANKNILIWKPHFHFA